MAQFEVSRDTLCHGKSDARYLSKTIGFKFSKILFAAHILAVKHIAAHNKGVSERINQYQKIFFPSAMFISREKTRTGAF